MQTGFNWGRPARGSKEHHKEWLETQGKDISGCAITGIISRDGARFNGEAITRSISLMHDRSNGLGGGFAAYGIYPEIEDWYAFHIMFDHEKGRDETVELISQTFEIGLREGIPTKKTLNIPHGPIVERLFVMPKEPTRARYYDMTDDDIVVMTVMQINAAVEGAFVFSSGKDMGVFKGVGYPEEIAEFFRLDEYEAYMWTAHGRFPTNTSGWWGGAHPFGLLDWSIVHNGEISSYGINKRYLNNFGYECSLRTDTEVIAYMFDLLIRKHQLPLEAACMAMAPPLWEEIERMDADDRKLATALRTVYGGALLNGPFSVVVGFNGGMVGFNDRIKLRPMTMAEKGPLFYVASEEAAIRIICPDPDVVRLVEGGVPVVATLEEETREKVA